MQNPLPSDMFCTHKMGCSRPWNWHHHFAGPNNMLFPYQNLNFLSLLRLLTDHMIQSFRSFSFLLSSDHFIALTIPSPIILSSPPSSPLIASFSFLTQLSITSSSFLSPLNNPFSSSHSLHCSFLLFIYIIIFADPSLFPFPITPFSFPF